MSRFPQKRTTHYGRSTNFGRQSNNSRRPKKAYIHPSQFVKPAQPRRDTEQYVPQHSFADFNVHSLIQSNISAMGFHTPSPIQDKTIPAGLEKRDVVGIANTGTGKTAAFAVPLLHRLLTEPHSKAIILAPTRELAQQIEEQCKQIAKGSGLTGALLIGGVPIGPQLKSLAHNPRVIIGTPGRVKDHMERKSLKLANCNIIVLDEVDRMLDMGFVNDIRHILGATMPQKQSLYFSATLDERVRAIIESFSHDPIQISVKSGETSGNVDQNVIPYVSNSDKMDKLHDVLIKEAAIKAIVFDDSQRSVDRLAKELVARGFLTDAIHGGKSQSQRQRVLKKFRDNEIRILVATDVAARGLDVADITHVINYTTPQSYADYVHRIGRTGRADKIGYALTFIER